MSIVDLTAFKLYVRDDPGVAGANDPTLQGYLDAASQEINNSCGRQFVVASASSARVFAVNPCSKVLTIDDCTAVSAVTENGSTVAAADYQLEPLNGRSPGGDTVPYDTIRRLYSYWYTDAGRAAISVTATWGWAAIPYQISEACKVLAKELVNNQDVRMGIVAATDAAAFGARTNSVVRKAIRDYARGEAAFAVA